MKNYCAIFAHYDRDQIIDDYVILYLLELKKVAQDIVFVSDGSLSRREKEKLDGICKVIIAEKHGEYDFGSWKRGLTEAIKFNSDMLILANDSCYLISPLVPIFEEMEERNFADFWGVAQSKQYGVEHVHSYFMVFNKKVFLSEVFKKFFDSVKQEKNKINIIKNYEIGLSKNLNLSSFKKDSFLQGITNGWNIADYKLFTNLIPAGFPFVKVGALVNSHFPISKIKFYTSEDVLYAIKINFIRRIGIERLLDSYAIFGFRKIILHKKFINLLIKKGCFIIKLLGITILKVRII